MEEASQENKVHEEEHIKSLYSAYSQSAQLFDKYCLYISSGAFSLSFAFITDIVDVKEATHKGLLIGSWGVFIGVIFISLIGHLLSTVANLKAIQFANLDHIAFNKKIKIWNYVIQGLNIFSILALLTGCCLLVTFIKLNF